MTPASLKIIVPVYNEGQNILRTLGQIQANVTTPYSVLIVYDFEEDNTLPVVSELIKKKNGPNISLVRNSNGSGALNAIKTGFEHAEDDDAVLVVMADSSDDLTKVSDMLEAIDKGYDIVCGSRYMKGGRQIGGPVLKGLLSRAAGLSLNLITGIPTHDISNSFKMYRKSILSAMEIESRGGFEVGMEIVVKAFLNGYRITEVPTIWQDRVAGKSRFKLMKWLPEYIRWYIYALKAQLKRTIKA